MISLKSRYKYRLIGCLQRIYVIEIALDTPLYFCYLIHKMVLLDVRITLDKAYSIFNNLCINWRIFCYVFRLINANTD